MDAGAGGKNKEYNSVWGADKMKKWDLVRFKREAECPAWLGRDARGVVVEEGELSSKVLFFNPEIIGDYLIAQVSNVGLCRERVSIPPQYTRQFEPKLGELDWSKEKFNKLTFKEFDMVRLIRDREEYSECGVYKGDIGCVAIDYAVQDYLLVDFLLVDEEGNERGDVISVRLVDIVMA